MIALNCGCIETYYDDGYNSECLKCRYPCLNCENESLCLSCYNLDNRNIYDSNCSCKLGYYDDTLK